MSAQSEVGSHAGPHISTDAPPETADFASIGGFPHPAAYAASRLARFADTGPATSGGATLPRRLSDQRPA